MLFLQGFMGIINSVRMGEGVAVGLITVLLMAAMVGVVWVVSWLINRHNRS